MGHLGRDAEVSFTPTGKAICKFSVAVSDPVAEKAAQSSGGKSDPAWYSVSLWGERGQKMAQYLLKGQAVLVIGRFKPRRYTNQDGEARMSLDIDASEVQFAGRNPNGAAPAQADRRDHSDDHPMDDDSVPF